MCAVMFRPAFLSLTRAVKGSWPFSITKLNSQSTSINPFVRLLATCAVSKNCRDEIEDQEFYMEYDPVAEKGYPRKTVVSNLQTIFGIQKYTAESMISKCPELKKVSLKSAQNNVQYFNEKGVPLHILRENPWLLAYKLEILTSKLELLKRLDLGDVCTILPLLRLTLYRLQEHSVYQEREREIIPSGNRIKYTCEKLQSNLEDVCKVFAQYQFLFSIPFVKYSKIMDMLLDAGAPPKYIIRDMWIFQYHIQGIKRRLKILTEVGVNPIKPWMLRSAPEVFTVTVRRELTTKEVLGENSVKEYLSQRLNCDMKTVECMISKYPMIPRIHVAKLKDLFDLLFAEGFTPLNILRVPRVLFHSVETIRFRVAELKDVGYTPTTLMVFCKSKRQYENILEAALRRKYRKLN